MNRKLMGSAIGAALLIFLATGRSDLILSRGSDALVTTFRVPLPGLLITLAAWTLMVFFFFKPRAASRSSLDQVPAGSRPNPASRRLLGMITVGVLGGLLIALSSHAIAVGTKRDIVELREFWGPFETRRFSAESVEAPLHAVFDNGFLVVQASSGSSRKSYLWLGIGPWALPDSICHHPLLGSIGPMRDSPTVPAAFPSHP